MAKRKCKKGTHKKGGRCVKNKRGGSKRIPANCKTFLGEKNKLVKQIEGQFSKALKAARAEKSRLIKAANAEARKNVKNCKEATRAARA